MALKTMRHFKWLNLLLCLFWPLTFLSIFGSPWRGLNLTQVSFFCYSMDRDASNASTNIKTDRIFEHLSFVDYKKFSCLDRATYNTDLSALVYYIRIRSSFVKAGLMQRFYLFLVYNDLWWYMRAASATAILLWWAKLRANNTRAPIDKWFFFCCRKMASTGVAQVYVQ